MHILCVSGANVIIVCVIYMLWWVTCAYKLYPTYACINLSIAKWGFPALTIES